MSEVFDPETGEAITVDGADVGGDVEKETPDVEEEVIDAEPLSEEQAKEESGGLDFYVTASEAAAMVTERLGKKTTSATFRRMVIDKEAPAPAGMDGTTIKWSQNVLDGWLDGLVETKAQEPEGAAAEASPDGRDFYLSAAEAAALLSEAVGQRITVAMFRRMVMAGEAPAAILQAGGTAKWSQAALDEWITQQEPRSSEGEVGPEEEPPAPKHENVYEFFENTYSPYYELHDSKVTPLNEAKPVVVWCEQWWLHKSVVGRLVAAWYAWEDAYTAGGGAMSSWILEHADRHFDRIMAEIGPFRKCKKGHTDEMGEYITEPCPPALRLPDDEETEESKETQQ